ncbi:MAG: RimK/LysX family protein [Cryomorphaceae bacterium]|jgi:hypothetical protein|nr:RimK/LysX family protein [Cryomorphaceae bacterium]
MKREKLIIGRRERASFPDINAENIEVKVDTGAYSSSIHVTECEITEHNGGQQLKVLFFDNSHPAFTGNYVFFDSFRYKKVKSSTGQEQMRYFVKMRINLAGKLWTTDFSLTRRNGMKYPILLGRKLLNKRFLVDPSKVDLTSKIKLA